MKRTARLASTIVLALTTLATGQEGEPDRRREDPRVDFLRERLELLEMRVELHQGLAELAGDEAEAHRQRFQVEIETTRARLEVARAQLDLSQNELRRAERLREEGALGESELEKLRHQALQARTGQRELQGRLESLESEFLATRVRAKRASLEAKLAILEARLEAAEARFELRQHERRGRLLRFDNDVPAFRSTPPTYRDPVEDGFERAPDNDTFRPVPDDEPFDSETDFDAETSRDSLGGLDPFRLE